MTILQRWFGARPPAARRAALRSPLLLLAAFAPGGLPAQTNYTPYAFTTLAGKASIGSADGPAATARFALPQDLAVDAAGNVFVADTENHTIRKIAPDGTVTTLAGMAGVAGATDAVGSAARFYWPEGIALDLYGNVFVADTGNQTIRKITSAGLVTTFAGRAGSNGNLDGTGTAASFNYPSGVALDGAGNLYVTETYNYDLRKITAAGAVTTLAGQAGAGGSADGVGSAARFSNPSGVATDASGNVFVADTYNDRICKVTPDGNVTTLHLADGTVASFDRPQKLGVDSAGNVFVSESTSHRMLRLTPGGELTTIATLPAAPPLDQDMVPYANGVAVDALGNVFVADTGNSTIRRITPAGALTTVAGFGPGFGNVDGTGSAARFYYPGGVAVDGAGNVYVADLANHAIRKITPGGVVTTLMSWVPSLETGFPQWAVHLGECVAVAADAAGNVYYADTVEHTVHRITAAGIVTTLAGMAGAYGSEDGQGTSARFVYPHSLAVDGAGNVFVADFLSTTPYSNVRTIRKITPSGDVSTPMQLSNASLAHIPTPLGIGIDGAGNIFAAESYGAVVWKIPPAGAASIIAGVPSNGSDEYADGAGAAVRFRRPCSLAVDASGTIFITDAGAIRRLTPDGVVTTLAGNWGIAGSADGAGSTARFNYPQGIAVDGMGRIYVADTDNHTIRVGVAGGPPAIVSQPQSLSVTSGGAAQFAVTISGVPEPTLQWYRNGAAIPGATTGTLSLSGVLASDAGDYTVTATNALGSVTSSQARLSVTAASAGPAPAAGGGTGAGGGGAVGGWFVFALALLAIGRWADGGTVVRRREWALRDRNRDL